MKSVVLLIIPLMFISCGEPETVAIPPGILPKEKMKMILIDIHIAEARSNLQARLDSASREELSFEKIFDKQQVTRAQYENSLSFYMDHPGLLDYIYKEVLNELSRRQGASGN